MGAGAGDGREGGGGFVQVYTTAIARLDKMVQSMVEQLIKLAN